jgi:hypothetical protein
VLCLDRFFNCKYTIFFAISIHQLYANLGNAISKFMRIWGFGVRKLWEKAKKILQCGGGLNIYSTAVLGGSSLEVFGHFRAQRRTAETLCGGQERRTHQDRDIAEIVCCNIFNTF